MITFYKRAALKFSIFIIFSAIFLTIYTLYFHLGANKVNGQKNELVTSYVNTEITSFDEKLGFPVRLEIPSIGVDANIQHVGFNSEGEMDVPDDINILGWYALGPRPGENGSAVIAGHLYGENGAPGIFANLSKVKEGDQIYILDSKGNSLSFIIKQQSIYEPGFAFDVFNRTDYPYLNLVTCNGYWDTTKNSYSKRLIVFSEIENSLHR